jgi:NNP family nitrate/nitrite transporter-like MFS transporter
MVWMMFAVIGIPLRKTLGLSATEFGLLASMPVLSGSLIRVPLGIWTDRFGGRIVLAILLAVCVPAVWMMSYATAYWQFLVIGLLLAWPAAPSRWARPMWRAGSPRSAGHGHGRVRRRQLGRGGQQVRRPGHRGGLRLDHGAQGLRRDPAGHAGAVLAGSASDPAHLVSTDTKLRTSSRCSRTRGC